MVYLETLIPLQPEYVAYPKPESVVMDNTVLLLSVQITKTKI